MMIAHIWNDTFNRFYLEISEGNIQIGFTVIGTAMFTTKKSAKQAAKLAGAQPWNY